MIVSRLLRLCLAAGCLLLLDVFLAPQATAHEIRPAYLEINRIGPDRYDVLWRTPVFSGKRLPVVLRLPDGVANVTTPSERPISDSVIERRVIDAPGGLAGKRIEFVGLQATITEVLVRIEMADGTHTAMIVRPSRPFVDVPADQSTLAIALTYLEQGVEHILFGFDHLLFVVALMLIVRDWRSRGRTDDFRGHGIHVFERDGEGPPLVLLHGFPSSSFDWRALLEAMPGRRILAFDFLGFGLSDKPRDHVYSLLWQADLTEELVARHGGGGPVFVAAHDMGTSVTTELLARDVAGRLRFELAGALLFNGSIVLARASLTPSQKLLRSRLGGLFARLSNERVFRQQFGGVFSEAHPLTDAEAADQWSLLCHKGGRTLGHRLVHYLDERERFGDRWHGAISDWRGPLSLAWGLEDPVATVNVLDAVIGLRPDAPVDRLAGLGHYPQIEDPPAIAAAVEGALARAGADSSGFRVDTV